MNILKILVFSYTRVKINLNMEKKSKKKLKKNNLFNLFKTNCES